MNEVALDGLRNYIGVVPMLVLCHCKILLMRPVHVPGR